MKHGEQNEKEKWLKFHHAEFGVCVCNMLDLGQCDSGKVILWDITTTPLNNGSSSAVYFSIYASVVNTGPTFIPYPTNISVLKITSSLSFGFQNQM